MPDDGSPTRLDMRGQMAIEHRSLDSLIPYAKNARTHSDVQVGQIAASMREFGWTNPILIDETGSVVAGHGRILAARKLGLMDDVPCVVLRGLSDTQKRALVLADNQLALTAGWNIDMLVQELGDLASDDFPLDLLGFPADDLSRMLHGIDLNGEGQTDPDDTPSVPVTPVAVLGDVWILGRHRLGCGDSTNPQHVDAVLAGVKPHLMVTDPPYGVNYDAGWRSGLDDIKRSKGKVLNDDRAGWRDV